MEKHYKNEKIRLVFHLYMVYEWDGEPTETEEMKPNWFDIDKIPYDSMFPDDKYWLPLVLEGKKIKAYFDFDEDWNVLSKSIEDLENEKVLNKKIVSD